MALNPESKYPSRRTYVLKLRSDATRGALAGKLENLVTGQQLEFASGSALVALVESELQACAAKPPAEDSDR